MQFNSFKNDGMKSADRFSVMPIGDSRTAGNQSVVLGGYKIPLFNLLIKHLGHAPRFTGTDMASTCFTPNCAVSGLTSAQILTAVQTQSPLFTNTKCYLIDMGTNDVIAGTATATTTGNTISVIDKIRTDNPSATIFVANLYDRSGKEAEIVAYNSALATAIQGIASYSATPTLGKTMLYDQYTVIGAYSATNYADLTHLNATGYNIAATGWYNQIITLF